jgi:hypothetical protein
MNAEYTFPPTNIIWWWLEMLVKKRRKLVYEKHHHKWGMGRSEGETLLALGVLGDEREREGGC